MNTNKYLSYILVGLLAATLASCQGSSSGNGNAGTLSLTDAADSLYVESSTLYVTIAKTADQTELTLSPGQTFTVNYTITVTVSEIEPAEGCSLTLAPGQSVFVTDTQHTFVEDTHIYYSDGTGTYVFNYQLQVGPYEFCDDYVVSNTACVQYNPLPGPPCCVTYDLDVHVPCYDGCTLTPGYWKTHSIYGPAPYDDTWAQIGEDTSFYGNGLSWYTMLWTPPRGGNAYIILAHAYIAAYLNELNGASVPDEIASTMSHAVGLLSGYTMSSPLSRTVRRDFIATAGILDLYNNGYIGPGHCSE